MARIEMVFARVGLVCVALSLGTPINAQTIEQACMKSHRGAGNRSLCNCLQDAASLTLTTKDQRLAATFFADPRRSQEIRQSKRRQHEAFWTRYENFGVTAEAFCGK